MMPDFSNAASCGIGLAFCEWVGHRQVCFTFWERFLPFGPTPRLGRPGSMATHKRTNLGRLGEPPSFRDRCDKVIIQSLPDAVMTV
jgi:hypothetical protein